jgi:hypothetical protein
MATPLTPIPALFANASRSAYNTLTATTHGAAVVMQIPEAGTIDAMAFGTAAAATPVPMTVRVETVSTAGLPSGSLIDANATGTMGGNVSANAVTVVAFAAGVAVTRGQLVALVVQPSTSPVSVQPASVGPTAGPWAGGAMPFGCTNTSGTWSKSLVSGFPMIGVRYDTGAYAYAGLPIPLVTSFTSRGINTGTGATTGTRRGIRFRLDEDFTLEGWWAYFSMGTSADGAMVLYDDAGAVLSTLTTVDASQLGGAGNLGYTFVADAAVSLTAGTWYRLAYVPSTGNTTTVFEAVGTVAGALSSMTGPGIEVQQCAFISSAWVDLATSTTVMGLFGRVPAATPPAATERAYTFVG